jgi:hypothetical protein
MRDYVGRVIAVAVQRRVQQAVGPAAAALAPERLRRAAARRLTALALTVELRQLMSTGQERRPRNGRILKRSS